jgi:putative MATE family efflux protein
VSRTATGRAPLEHAALEHAAALGSRPIGRLLWHSCSQTTLSVGAYGIYALTNAWFVAHGVGAAAMAAVNLVAPVLLFVGAISTTVGVGGGSLVSRALGAGDTAAAARAAGNAFVLFWASAIATTAVGLAALGPLLTLLGARGTLYGPARAYLIVLLCGAIVGTGFSSLVRAEGRIRFSTLLWLIPVLTQVVLDPSLIYGLRLGVRGAALGTVGGQTVSAGMSLWFFFVQRRRPYRITLADLRPHAPTIRALFSVGSPSFLAGLGATVLAVLVNASLSRSGGATALAAYAVCARIQTFATMPQTGISQGLQPVVGYNHGRTLPDRVLRARTLALRASIGYGLLVMSVVTPLAPRLVAVFVSDPAITATAVPALRIIAFAIAAAGVAPLVSAYFQSLGRPRPSYLLSLGTLPVLKIPLVLALGRLGVTGIWLGLALGEAACALVALAALRYGERRGRRRARSAGGEHEALCRVRRPRLFDL